MFNIQKRIQEYKLCKDVISFDFETTGLQPYHGDRAFSFCFGDENYCHVVRLDNNSWYQIETEKLLYCIQNNKNIWKYIQKMSSTEENNFKRLKDLIEQRDEGFINIALIIHNCKFEKSFCKIHDIDFRDDLIVHDPMLMSRLLDNQAISHELIKLVFRLGGDPFGKMTKIDKLVKEENEHLGGYQFINEKLMTEYQFYDAIMPLMLHGAFLPEIMVRENLFEDYIWEVHTALVSQEIEQEGIKVHEKNCNKLLKWLDEEIDKMQHECFDLVGEYINMSSPRQIERVLFKKLKFPIISFSNKGAAKTDKDVVFKLQEEYDHPFLNLLIKWRSYTGGKSNIQSYIDLMDEYGKIHTTLSTCQAKTHRQSSSKPNLQNVAKESALKNPFPVPARQCFTC